MNTQKKYVHFLIICFSVFFLCAPFSLASAKPVTHTVSITGMKFVPDDLEIAVGDTVIWKNEDIVPHTVTDKSVWNSGTLLSDKNYKFKFKRSGSYSYSCQFHPLMTARITVK